MSASRIIVFNPDQSKYLVGKESYFITNIKDITNEMKHTLDILFTRQVNKIKEHNDYDEIKFYTKQLQVLHKNNSIMKIIRKYSYSERITFGDIKYKKSITTYIHIPFHNMFREAYSIVFQEVSHQIQIVIFHVQ
jgi:hypothetical protein